MKSLQTRATGASCKECRRLKIKCDKQVPCGTCTKRGLQSLCPDGQLSGTKGSRYVLASAEESWHRIQALCVRVQDLEYALEKAHAAARLNFAQHQHSDFTSSSSSVASTSSYPLAASERHPLLEPELIKIGQDPRAVVVKSPESQHSGSMPPSTPDLSTSSPMPMTAVAKSIRPPDEVPIAQMGTMKISKPGSYRWLGIGDVAHDNEYPFPSRLLNDLPTLPPDLLQSPERHGVICATKHSADELKKLAFDHLPPPQEALHLIDKYFQFSWQWPIIIDRPTVLSTLYHPAYSVNAYAMSTYNLSALFSLLAMGSLYDPNIDSSCHEFKSRRQLARALFFYNWPRGPTAIDEMESLLLLFRTSWPFLDTSAAANYELLAWGIKLGGKLGLHRDPEPLKLSVEEAERRRRVFWGMWFHDSILSLNFGQPPTLAKGFVNCRPPQEASAESIDGDLHPQLTLILQDMLAHFMESGPSPPYAAVLRLDRKIREVDATRHMPAQDLLGRDILGNPIETKPHSVSPSSASAPPSAIPSTPATTAASMEGGDYKPKLKIPDTRPPWLREIANAFNRGLKCLMLLTLHKTYFSYAILRPEENAVEGKLALSVSATYEAATGLLECALVVSRHAPWLQVRYSPNWVHYQTACMVLYAFAIYTPGYPKVEEAMAAADKAVNDLFLAHGRDSAIATASLPSVLKCQTKAKESLAKWRVGRWSHPTSQQDVPEDELPTEALFNEKLIITNSLPPPSAPTPRILRHHNSGSISLSLSNSTGASNGNGNGTHNVGSTNHGGDGSRGSTPSDMVATSSSMYGEGSSGSSAFHGHQWMNTDIDSPLVVTPDLSSVTAATVAGMNPSPSTYGGMGSSYFPQQPSHGHLESAPQASVPVNDGYGHTQNHSMDWSNAAPVMKVESPPPQPELVYGNQYTSSSTASMPGAGLLQVPSPVEDYQAAIPPVRRIRGLSRARSFPSDHHHIASPNVYPPTAGMHSQLYQPMMLSPVHSVSSVTPSTMTPDHQGSFMHQQSYLSHSIPHSQHPQHPQTLPPLSSRPPAHEPYGQWINHSPSSPDDYGTRVHTSSSGHFSPTTDMHAHHQSSYLEPRRTSASIPLHALEQAWSSLNVQQR
ncbi:hypothetical protein PIIN_04522 [Serendipita indica DSM 11827]|uniref:Zn(2)-C6 fungal-type domain-containing protein n=1 Tax=Serendipita indica (strain DSM 11827) TaxID=1109443 RepID=G4TGZ1_SERID|nr:hypothetical protein PIIN_04522 [Serendipita indica DSM 11827]